MRTLDGGNGAWPAAFLLQRPQIATAPGLFGSPINSVLHPCWVDEMLSQMGNVFQKQHFVPERNVIEQYEVLMNLPHVADMRNHAYGEFLRHDGDGQIFAD